MKAFYLRANILFFLLLISTYINYSLFMKIREKGDLSLSKYISRNTGDKLIINSEYNLFFFVTPLDCHICNEDLLKTEFIDKLEAIFKAKRKPASINYIVSGDYTLKEKLEYISQIKNRIHYYIDKNNKANTYLLNKYGSAGTPFLLILKNNGEMQYWQYFIPDMKYENKHICSNLLKLIEVII